MTSKPFVPPDFTIPSVFETDHFRLRMLSTEVVDKDYEAVIESQKLLHKMFGGPWPRDGFTIEENRKDLVRHQQEFLDRKAFAYTVVSLDESRVLGCLYINPIPASQDLEGDAYAVMWVRQSEYDKGLDDILFTTIKQWMHDNWPFEKVLFPNRQ